MASSRVMRPPRADDVGNIGPKQRRAATPLRALRSRYVVLEKLGAGCAGTVVRAVERSTRAEVAVKIVAKRLLVDAECKRALVREVSVLSRLDHANVVGFTSAFEDAEHVYIATELCPSGDLHEYLRARRTGLDEREALKYLRQLLQALEYLHAHGIAHRDVKLENVMFSEAGKLKLIDFGLCFWRRPGGDLYSSQHCGTPQYAAPEIMAKSSYVPESGDMWSCGVVLYAMLTRSLPFTGASWSDLERNIASANTSSIMKAQALSHISPGTAALLRSLLHTTPSKRPSAKEALVMLDTAILNCVVRAS